MSHSIIVIDMDWQAQQFYSLTPEGTPVLPEQESPKKSGKKILILTGVFLGVVVLGLGIWGVIGLFSGEEVATEEAEVCTLGEAGCSTIAALETSDIDSCASLSGDEKINCEDLAYLSKSQDEDDESWCKKIKSEILATSCEDNFAAQESLLRIEDASLTGNPLDCEALENTDDQVNCLDVIASIDEDEDGLTRQDEYAAGTLDTDWDADNDGLNDGEEVSIHGTDPREIDTDGDGFSDFVEVQSGYDPLVP
ncbi:MAG: hypothetical protein WC730_01185 [Patescibacteria group bacterium]|jgi:hypothetical protein